MPQYIPIAVTPNIISSRSNLLDFQWSKEAINADFLIPGDETSVLRVHFRQVIVVRVLDEMPLSTKKEETPNDGLIPEHFAYIVDNALFWLSQSDVIKAVFPSARHYRFITGWICLDVVSDIEPNMTTIARPLPTLTLLERNPTK